MTETHACAWRPAGGSFREREARARLPAPPLRLVRDFDAVFVDDLGVLRGEALAVVNVPAELGAFPHAAEL